LSILKNKWLYIFLVIAAVIIFAAFNLGKKDKTQYFTAKIDRGDIREVVEATGTINAVTSVQVGSQVSGQIKDLFVDYNSPVKRGQLIARIDPQSFTLKVNQALADVEAARAAALTQRSNVAALQAQVARAKVLLADAEREYNRNQMLFEKNFVSEAVRDKALSTLEAAREQLKTEQAQLAVGDAQVRNAEAVVRQRESQLAQAKVDLERTDIRAPVDGVVVKKSVEPGQTVAASLQAPELFIIAQDLREMQVDTSIDEAEVGRIRVGQEATFTVDSFPGRTFHGSVAQIRKAAQVVQNVVTYIGVIRTANPDLELFPGMTANVRIIVDTRENALKVSNAALRFRPAGVAAENAALNVAAADGDSEDKTKGPAHRKPKAKPERHARHEAGLAAAGRREPVVVTGRVWVPGEEGKPRAVPVRLGLTDGIWTEVVSGDLHEGTEVIVGIASDAAKGKAQQKKGLRFGF